MNYLLNTTKLTVIIDGAPHIILKEDPRYKSIINAAISKDEEKVRSLLSANSVITLVEDATKDSDFVVKDGVLTFRGFEITGTLNKVLTNLIMDGFEDLGRWKLFVEKLMKNPSATSISELFDFMDYKDLPITQEGNLIAYKGVSNDFYSCHGNKKTVVIEGDVDDSGRIHNGIGKTIEVARSQVDDNRSIGCSFGLHVGSYDYAASFGAKLLLVEVDPADVVSVPHDCSCQKMRVCKYKVLSESTKELEVATIDTSSDVKAEDQVSEKKRHVELIKEIVEDARGYGDVEFITVKDIKKELAFYGEKLKSVLILQALIGLDYHVEPNNKKPKKSKVLFKGGFEDDSDTRSVGTSDFDFE